MNRPWVGALLLFNCFATLGGALGGQPAPLPEDPFLRSERRQPAIKQSPVAPTQHTGEIEQTGWSAADDESGQSSVNPDLQPAELNHSIYQTEENPSEVLEPGYVPLPLGPNQGQPQPIYHSTDVGPNGMIHAGGMMQSPEFNGAPDPTPVEPPPYTFLPEPNPNQPPKDEIPPALRPGQVHGKTIATWLPAGANDLGLFDLDLTPLVIIANGVTLTGGFQVHFVDGPTQTDLPPRLYNARVELGWMKQLNPRFGFQVVVAPGIWSDFDNMSSQAWRFTGRALGFYGWTPQTQLVLGIAYLDREDLTVLPAVGAIYVPNPDYRFELLFPKPKLAYRLSQVVGPAGSSERWAYLTGEFGGGSWAIERANGADDVVTYSDWRLIMGIEKKSMSEPGWLVEVGYVFNRELEYKDGPGSFDPGATGMMRAGFTY